MKGLYYALLLLCISAVTFNCQKEISYSIPGIPHTGNNNIAPITATLQGNILDETGQPAIDVMVKAGTKTAITNAHGYFRIVNAALDKNAALVVAEKAGYFKAYRTFNATSGVNQVVIKLIKKTVAGTINATTGGDVVLSNGTKISLPANGVVKASDGIAYTSSIQVYAAYIDPKASDIGQTVPGSFIANDKDGKRVTLASYGMLAVELESSTGEKLQIVSGNTATLTAPIPSSLQSSAPASIALWYVDEQTGIWKEEGIATRNGNNYVGEVKHFSFWNCDIGIPAITLSLILQNNEGFSIVHATVRITGTGSGYPSYAQGWTDSLGQVSGLVPANESLLLEVLAYPCNNVIYSQNIGPFSQNTNLGTITVPNTSSSLVTIKGKLHDCTNQPVTNGYAIINYDNMTRYAHTNSYGDFTINFITCSGGPATCEILGVDITAEQQGTTAAVTLVSPVTNASNILACGTSTAQYINYTLDGTNYSISGTTNDSLFAYTDQVQTNPPNYTGIMGLHGSTDYIHFGYLHNATAGAFALLDLTIQDYDSTTALVQPFNITITNYPQSIGGFYEGSFSGQFTHYSTGAALHSINCSFKVRRQ